MPGGPGGERAPPRLDGHGHDGLGGARRLQHDRGVRRAQGRARAGRLEPDQRHDVARHRLVHLGVPVGLHPQDPPGPLDASRAGVQVQVLPRGPSPSGDVRVLRSSPR